MNAFLILWSVVQIGKPNLLTEQIILKNSAIPFEQAVVLVAIESSFRTNLPKTAAQGLMQVTPVALKEIQNRVIKYSIRGDALTDTETEFLDECLQVVAIKKANLSKPQVSVRAGSCYFKLLLIDYDGDIYKAVTHYNGGGAAVKALLKHKPWPETRDYLGKFDRFSYYIGAR